MLTAFYRSGDGAVARADDADMLRHALADPKGLLWADILINDPQRDAALLRDVFRFHPLTIEDCTTPRVDPAKIDDHGEYIFIVTQGVSAFNQEEELQAAELDLFLGPNYLISCHLEPLPAIDHFRQRCQADERIFHRTSDWLLHGIMDALVDDFLPVVDALDEEIDQLEEGVLQNPTPDLLNRIRLLRRNALRLRRATVPQREVIQRLSRSDFPRLIHEETQPYFRDIYDHLVRVEFLVDAVRELAEGALNSYLSAVSNRLNEVVKVLTAAAAIFLPLTMVSGIYGMNFARNQFPAFESDWGFGAVVGMMVALAIGLLAYFRWRRWI